MGRRIDDVLGRIDRVQQRHKLSAFAVAVVKKASDDRGSSLAALLTYYGLLSLFPILLVGFTVLGWVLEGDPSLRDSIRTSALADFPIIGKQLGSTIHPLGGNGPALAFGLVLLVWGALGVTQVAQRAMADIWNVPEDDRPGLPARLLRGLALLGVLGLFVLVSTGLAGLGVASGSGTLGLIGGVLGSLVVNVGMFVLAFRIMSPASVATRDLVAGAAASAAAWTALQSIGGTLVAHQLRHSSELYGFFAVVLGLIFWIYLGAQVVVYGAELNVVRTRRLWPRSMRGHNRPGAPTSTPSPETT